VIAGLATGNYRVEFDGGVVCYRKKIACDGFNAVGLVSPGGRTGINAVVPG